MKWPQFICTVLLLGLLAVDVVLVSVFGVRGSISQWMRDMGYSSPVFLLGLGYLLGHFFGDMDTTPRDLTKKEPPQ